MYRRAAPIRGLSWPDEGMGKYDVDDEEESDNGPNDFECQRRKVMSRVVLPLADLLATCYGILDNLPDRKISPTEHADGTSKNPGSRRTKNRPPPPRGMLSLRDYTDVACLLEFIVCTGILPLQDQEPAPSSIQNNNSNSSSDRLVEDRLRTKLPKSLAGRIPKDALRWGSSSISNSDPTYLFVRATDVITRVVLLDRFRPMLLPRHIVDIYGACFRIEYLVSNTVLTDIDETEIGRTATKHYPALALTLPPSSVFSSSSKASGMMGQRVVVDPTLRAMAFQTLLSSSSRSLVSTSKKPQQQQQQQQQLHDRYQRWLQKHVSALLTDLATRDIRGLSAILTVFVPVLSSSTDQTSLMSSASQRLGRTLAAMVATAPRNPSNENGTPLPGRLCQQFLELLSASFVGSGEANEKGNEMAPATGIPPRSMAVIQTAWAVFEHLPHPTIDEHVLRRWTSRLRSTETTGTVRETIRQVGALCTFVPPHSGSAVKFLQRAVFAGIGSDGGEESVLLGQILRVAVLPNSSVTSREAEQTLLLLTQAMYAGDEGEDTARDKIVAAWISALGATQWDLAGHSYACKMLPRTDGRNPVEEITPRKHRPLFTPTAMEEFAASVQSTTERSEFFVEKILLVLAPPIDQTSSEEDASPSLRPLQGLPSRIFRFLLHLYLSQDDRDNSGVNTRLVPTVLLPIMCEKCSQEQLLFGEKVNASGLLLVIRQVLSELTNPKPQTDASDVDDNKDDHRHELLKSIAGILMSLLIALVEVGSKSRSEEEEDLLHSFLPILQSLSVSADAYHSDRQVDRKDDAAMADMAAYAMPLIASRKSVTSNGAPSGTPTKPPSPEERLQDILDEAENDLESTQAPIRAKGMVSLGRLARGFTGALTREQKAPSLIRELDAESGKELATGDRAMTDWIEKVLKISMVALGDSESYVYLAAIQTIVAVGDLHPQRVLPKIATAIVKGELDVINTSRDNAPPSATIRLSQEQIIKLAEALIFIIRRRAVTDEYVPMLVSLMLRSGNTKISSTKFAAKDGPSTIREPPRKDSVRIRQETDRYFATGRFGDDETTEEEEDEDTAGPATQRELRDERDVRLRTGGPIFEFEEADVVRSLRITVLSELVASAANPSALVPCVRLLSRTATEALHLEGDGSRIVQRSAALLARELYARIVEEAADLIDALEEEEDQRASPTLLPLSVALVEGDEESSLCATLRSMANGERSHANGTTVATDPAVVARCSEALSLRTEAEQRGAFLASQLVLEERRALERLPSVVLRKLASTSMDGNSSDAIGIKLLNPIETLR